MPEVGAGASSLPPRALRVVRAVASCMFEGGAGIPPERLDRFESDLADWARYAGPKTRLGLRMGLGAVQWLPILTVRRFARFTRLAPEMRTRHLHTMERFGMLAPLLAGLKTVFAILWFEDPADPYLPAQPRVERKA